jgi:hypothetical protein
MEFLQKRLSDTAMELARRRKAIKGVKEGDFSFFDCPYTTFRLDKEARVSAKSA